MEVRLQLSRPGWPKSLNWALICTELTGTYCLTKHNYYSTCITGSMCFLLTYLFLCAHCQCIQRTSLSFQSATTTFRKALLPPKFFTFKMEKFDLARSFPPTTRIFLRGRGTQQLQECTEKHTAEGIKASGCSTGTSLFLQTLKEREHCLKWLGSKAHLPSLRLQRHSGKQGEG